MQTTSFFLTTLAATLLATTPLSTVTANETQDSVAVLVSGMTVNGRPATPQEKAMAKDIAKQGAKMGGKAAQMAVAAVTNPKKAKHLSAELEAMGQEMERMGDSLEALSEDTTFFYEGADTVMLSESDTEDFIDGVIDGWNTDGDSSWLNTWWGKLVGGGLGVAGGILAVVVVILVLLLVFVLLLSPLWLVVLGFYFIYRSSKRREQAIQQAIANGQPLPEPNPIGISHLPHGADAIMWNEGIRQCCLGVGLTILFWAVMGVGLLWGIGVLITCLGVSKLIIASTVKSQKGATGAPQNPNTPAD